ncbi:MAG: hypothetical protein ACI8W8_002822 [Rhodothermales bacterium]|jgi:hypothetical protein
MSMNFREWMWTCPCGGSASRGALPPGSGPRLASRAAGPPQPSPDSSPCSARLAPALLHHSLYGHILFLMVVKG